MEDQKLPTLSEVAEIIKIEEKQKQEKSLILSSVSQLDDLMESLGNKSILSSPKNAPLNMKRFKKNEEEEIIRVDDENEFHISSDDSNSDGFDDGFGDDNNFDNISNFSTLTPIHSNLHKTKKDENKNSTILSTVNNLENITFMELKDDEMLTTTYKPPTMRQSAKYLVNSVVRTLNTTLNPNEEDLESRKKKKEEKKKMSGPCFNTWFVFLLFFFQIALWILNFPCVVLAFVLFFVHISDFKEDFATDLNDFFFYLVHWMFTCFNYIVQMILVVSVLSQKSVYSKKIKKDMKTVIYTGVLFLTIFLFWVYNYSTTITWFCLQISVGKNTKEKILVYVMLGFEVIMMFVLSCCTGVICIKDIYECCMICLRLRRSVFGL